MKFYEDIGEMALGTRLRRLSNRFSEHAHKLYLLYEVELDPKWFPVFYCLSTKTKMSVTEIANTIGHSHPSVSQIAKEMIKEGIVSYEKKENDRRITVLSLTEKGKRVLPKLAEQYQDVSNAVKQLIDECEENIWHALDEMEHALSKQNFYTRVCTIRKDREQKLVEIIDYEARFADSFKKLNYAWIQKYFQIEDLDVQSLENHKEKILDKGGYICFAKYHGQIVGTCALIKLSDQRYELSKMAVTEMAQGKGIGMLLGKKIIDKAKILGAKSIFIESNTKLEPAINLYYKLGFKKMKGGSSLYTRSNIQMELALT